MKEVQFLFERKRLTLEVVRDYFLRNPSSRSASTFDFFPKVAHRRTREEETVLFLFLFFRLMFDTQEEWMALALEMYSNGLRYTSSPETEKPGACEAVGVP